MNGYLNQDSSQTNYKAPSFADDPYYYLHGHENNNTDIASNTTNQPDVNTLKGIQQGYADMLRSEYEDWKQRFRPYDEKYRQLVTDPAQYNRLNRNALNYVDHSVGSALGQTRAAMSANDKRYGRVLSPEEKAARDRRLGNQEALSLAGGRTNMRQALHDRKLQMLSGGIR